MAKQVNRLDVKKVESIKSPGYHHDGFGLYLQVTPTGAKTWLFRYVIDGKERWMGLGSVADVSLGAARLKRDTERAVLKGQKADPVARRQAERRKASPDLAKSFEACAKDYIAAQRDGWRDRKYADEWQSTVDTYVAPIFRDRPVSEIDTGLVLDVIRPLWTSKNETANRLRGRIETVLGWAKAHGYRSGENPATWRGHLDKLLPKRSKVSPVQHRPAMPYHLVPAFVAELRDKDDTAARALEFTILCASRVGEVVGATWAEIDEKAKVWTVPGSRMKSGRPHRVPLTDAALAVLKRMKVKQESEFVFPGQRTGRPLTIAAPLKQLKDMGHGKLTTHGFRSAFRDWAGETTNYPREVCEAALAHAIKDSTEAAYARGDLLERRAVMMADWGQYLAKPRPDGEVIPLPRRAAQ